METFGPYLKRMRALKGRTLEDLAAQTRIDARYCQALEDEQFSRLPHEVFVRGFVRAYARALGLDEVEAFRLFDEAARPFYGPDEEEAQARAAAARRASARRRRLVAWASVVVASVVVAVAIGLWSTLWSGASRQAGAPPPAATVEITRPPGTGTVPPQPRAPEPLRLVLEAVDLTWISVRIDQTLTKEALLRPGDRVEYEALEAFNVTTGNAGGLHARLNGRPLTPFGRSGQVVRDIHIGRDVSDAGAEAGR